jgi:hypothetical protein
MYLHAMDWQYFEHTAGPVQSGLYPSRCQNEQGSRPHKYDIHSGNAGRCRMLM